MLLIKDIQFINISNCFQNKFKSVTEEIRKCGKIFVTADKSRNKQKKMQPSKYTTNKNLINQQQN